MMQFNKKDKEIIKKNTTDILVLSSVYNKSRKMECALRNNRVTVFLNTDFRLSFSNENFYFRLVLEVQKIEFGHEIPHARKR